MDGVDASITMDEHGECILVSVAHTNRLIVCGNTIEPAMPISNSPFGSAQIPRLGRFGAERGYAKVWRRENMVGNFPAANLSHLSGPALKAQKDSEAV